MRALAALTLSGAILASAAGAQQRPGGGQWTMPPQYREIQLRAQQTQRDLLLAMADSMPEKFYRDAAARGQRDFAQQIHHAANADLYLVSRYVLGTDSLPFIQDSATTFGTRAGLKRFINAAYDYSTAALRGQTEADRASVVWYFNQKLPKWQIWDELNQHTIWTAGQIVANFRRHGMPPPAFQYF